MEERQSSVTGKTIPSRSLSNRQMKDLQNPRWMYLKAMLFLVIGFGSAALLALDNFKLQTVVLLFLTIWSMCRACYFAFHVIEHYVDPSFKFSGLISVCRYWLAQMK